MEQAKEMVNKNINVWETMPHHAVVFITIRNGVTFQLYHIGLG
jgi:hypothetical protein